MSLYPANEWEGEELEVWVECPVCREPMEVGARVGRVVFSGVLNGAAYHFAVPVCRVDAALCNVFPSLRDRLFEQEAPGYLAGQGGWHGGFV